MLLCEGLVRGQHFCESVLLWCGRVCLLGILQTRFEALGRKSVPSIAVPLLMSAQGLCTVETLVT